VKRDQGTTAFPVSPEAATTNGNGNGHRQPPGPRAGGAREGLEEAPESVEKALEQPGCLARRATLLEAMGEGSLAQVIRAELAWSGRCTRCGRRLVSSESLTRGVGAGCQRAGRH
jgi:hypothetical protein